MTNSNQVQPVQPEEKLDDTTQNRIDSTEIDVSKIKVKVVKSLMGDKLSSGLQERLVEEVDKANQKVVDEFAKSMNDIAFSLIGVEKKWGQLELNRNSHQRSHFMNKLLSDLEEEQVNDIRKLLDEAMKTTIDKQPSFFTKSDVRQLSSNIRRIIKQSHSSAITKYMDDLRKEAEQIATAIAPVIVHEMLGVTREEIVSDMVMAIVSGDPIKLDKIDLDQEKVENLINKLDSGIDPLK